MLVAGLVLLLDRDLWLALPWAVGGVILGRFSLTVLRPFGSPLEEWYEKWRPDWDAQQQRIAELAAEGWTQDEAIRLAIAEERFWAGLFLPPLLGLAWGVLLGGISGALCSLDGDWGLSSSASAALGVLAGPPFTAFVVSATLACIVHPIPGRTWLTRTSRRALLMASPLLFVPCAWHCARALLRRTAN